MEQKTILPTFLDFHRVLPTKHLDTLSSELLKLFCKTFVFVRYFNGDTIPLGVLLEAAEINLNDTLPEYNKPIRETGAYIFLTILGNSIAVNL